MKKIELKSVNDWSNKPNGDGLYMIKTDDGDIEFAIIWGEGDRIRITEVHNGGDSESINHPFYEGAKFLGPIES